VCAALLLLQGSGLEMHVRQWAAFGILCVIWGSTWAAIRVLVGDVPPMRAAAVRFLIAGVVALVWMLIKRERMPCGTEWRALLLLSVAMIAAPFAIIFWAEQSVASGTTALVYSAVPVFISFLGPLVKGHVGETPRRAVLAMTVGMGGIALLLQGAIRVSWAQTWGIVALLAAVAMSAWATIYAKTTLAAKGSELHAGMSSAWQFLLGAAWLEAASLLLEHGQPGAWTHEAVAAELFLSIVGSVVAFTLYYWLLKHWEPYKIGMMQLILPVVAVTEGALLLHERLQWQMAVAMVVILGSVAFVMRAQPVDDEPVTIQIEG